MKIYKTFFPTCSGRRSAVGWSGFLSGTIFHAFRAGFFLSSKGPSFFWGKGSSLLAGLLFKRKEAISHTIILRGGGRQSNLLFLQKEAKLPFLFVNRPHSGTLKFEIPKLHFITRLLMKNCLNITFARVNMFKNA